LNGSTSTVVSFSFSPHCCQAHNFVLHRDFFILFLLPLPLLPPKKTLIEKNQTHTQHERTNERTRNVPLELDIFHFCLVFNFTLPDVQQMRRIGNKEKEVEGRKKT